MVVVASTKHIYLGNKILLYAHFIGSAIENNYKLKNPSFAPYYKHFSATQNDFNCRFPIKKSWVKGPKWLRMLNYKLVYYFTRILIKLKLSNRIIGALDIGWDKTLDLNSLEFLKKVNSTKRLCVQGWQYRNNENIIKHADAIRNYFTPNQDYQLNINQLISDIRNKSDIIVGIHIRQGDYKNFKNGLYYFESEQYADIMKQAINLFPNKKVSFLICSNVPQNGEIFNGLDIHYATGHFVEDMYSLAKCDYIIGPPSTFSMWASFYGAVPLKMIDKRMTMEMEEFKVHIIDE